MYVCDVGAHDMYVSMLSTYVCYVLTGSCAGLGVGAEGYFYSGALGAGLFLCNL